MTSLCLPRIVRLVAVLAVMLFVLSNAAPASAKTSCFQDLGSCYQAAALIDGFWGRFLAGLDCEVDLAVCLQRAVTP